MNSEFPERDLPSHEMRAGGTLLGFLPGIGAATWRPPLVGEQPKPLVVDEPDRTKRPQPKDETEAPFAEEIPPGIRMTESVRRTLFQELGSRRPEQGGILLGPADEETLVTHFVFDDIGRRTAVSYTPDAAFLNRTIRQFRKCGLTCVGICHSHPRRTRRLSTGDLEWARVSFANPRNKDNAQIFMPIFCDGVLYPYVVTRHAVLDAEIQIV